MNKLVKTVDKNVLYFEYIKSLNGILQLTDRELELMAKLIEFDLAFKPTNGESKNIINAKYRKEIKDTIGITPDNLSRYLKRLKLNGLIINGKADGDIIVNPILIPQIIKDRVQITIILKVNEDK